MKTTFEMIQDKVRVLKLDDSLLALNHFLSVSRHLTVDHTLQAEIKKLKFPPPSYIVHFLAKQLLLNASNLGHQKLEWPLFLRLIDLCISLDDPIQHDPNWEHTDPTGFFERILTQQITSQTFKPVQQYGLALGLFRDVGVINWPASYDLRADIEANLGISVEQFIAMGHLCLALRQASHNGHKCMGTFTHMFLAEAFARGIAICVPEIWSLFLQRVACNRDTFREISSQPIYKVSDPHFVQFEFNPLHRFPITEALPEHFISVDPYLIVERTTLGMFYDLFERDNVKFATRFGHAFDCFVGQLLQSACPAKSLWSASAWEQKQIVVKRKRHSKIGDWAYSGNSHTILFECKSLRPSLELTTYGADDNVQQVSDRIASGLEQLIHHSTSIQQGRWRDEGLMPGQVACVVVTYGRISTINGPFTRKRIRESLTQKGLDPPPFVILSVEELDTVIRLVELGKPLDEVILALTAMENGFDVGRLFHNELNQRLASSFTYDKGKQFLEDNFGSVIRNPIK